MQLVHLDQLSQEFATLNGRAHQAVVLRIYPVDYVYREFGYCIGVRIVRKIAHKRGEQG